MRRWLIVLAGLLLAVGFLFASGKLTRNNTGDRVKG